MRRTALNILLVFALGGLWHGAAWTFVIWGIYQGALVAGYYAFKRMWDNMPLFVQRTLTFLLVVVGWVFFRSTDVPMALTLLDKMFHLPAHISLSSELARLAVWNGVLLCVVNLLSNTNTFKGNRNPLAAIGFACLFVLSIIAINSLRIEFLYYQF
jgi:alginate O-acetyltransferase complex protein AlgI